MLLNKEQSDLLLITVLGLEKVPDYSVEGLDKFLGEMPKEKQYLIQMRFCERMNLRDIAIKAVCTTSQVQNTLNEIYNEVRKEARRTMFYEVNDGDVTKYSPIQKLGLPRSINNTLMRNNVYNISQLLCMIDDLKSLRNVGDVVNSKIIDALESHGFEVDGYKLANEILVKVKVPKDRIVDGCNTITINYNSITGECTYMY